MDRFDTRNSRRWWARGGLAALAATAAATALAFGGGGLGGEGPMMGGPEGHGMHMGPGHGGPGIERLLDESEATKEQRIKIRQIMVAAEEDLRAAHESARPHEQHEAMMKLLTQPRIDAAAVEKLRAQEIAQHDAASRRMTQAMVDAANVLTPEQRKKLADRMAQRQERREKMMRGQGEGPDAQPGRAGDAATR